ncbi:ABC transporter permease [Enterococcus sp. AZ109]|uniref:ABC transporter permease n=1 Tax=Enterococcus sp. AZ109 TaxID=2774634 RepID=UPI003F263FC7
MSLLLKEIKINLKSLTYWVIVIILGLFAFSQIGGDLTGISKPTPNQSDYGMTQTDDPQVIQESAYQMLLVEYVSNTYSSYPYGFLKSVRLSDTQQQEIEEILTSASGRSIELLTEDYINSVTPDAKIESTFPVKKDHSYKKFQADMRQAAGMIGKKSNYEEEIYRSDAFAPRTYEQAMEDFQIMVEKDQVSGAYARMVCDYFGIILALVPIFPAAAAMVRDKRAQAQQVIFTKQTSTGKLILSRYLSCVLLLLVPVLLFSLMPGMQTLMISESVEASGNLLLFYQYMLGWLLPTILAVVGIGFMLTELTNGIVTVVFQLIAWLGIVFTGSGTLVGAVGWSLVPRFNTVGERDIFEAVLPELIKNRLAWSVVGLVCCGGTILLADYKRKGGRLLGKRPKA